MPDKKKKSKIPEDLLDAFTQMYNTLIKPQFDELRQVIGRLDQGQQILRVELRDFKQEVQDFKQEFQDFKQEALGHFDAIYRQLETLRMEYYAITQGLRRLEQEVAELKGSVARVERDVTELKGDIAELKEERRSREALKAEFLVLKEQVNSLQNRLAVLEAQFSQN
jgi:chromosome segregation ATPase